MSSNHDLWYLWQTSTRMAMEVPMVMSQRMWMFSQPWTEKTVAEYQLMFAEKAQGWGEMWQIWLQTAPMLTCTTWQSPMTTLQYQKVLNKSIRSANKSIKPLSRRVHANHRRLNK